MTVRLLVPGALAEYAGGRREIDVDVADATVGGLFDQLALDLPALERRIRDERTMIRRHVNIYVDGSDVRDLAGPQTPVREGATVQIIAAVSGG